MVSSPTLVNIGEFRRLNSMAAVPGKGNCCSMLVCNGGRSPQ